MHPTRTSAVLLLHRRTRLITTILFFIIIFLVSTPGYFQPRMRIIVLGECKANTPGATAKGDSEVVHIWQCILPLKTLTVEVEKICMKWFKTNLQSFWIMKRSYSMPWFCCTHTNANNLSSKGTVALWQKLNNLQNSNVLNDVQGRKGRWEENSNCKALNLLVHRSCQAQIYSTPVQTEELNVW